MTKESILDLLARERAYLAREYGVRRLGLFGSFARGEAGEESDVDLVVELDRPLGLRFVDLAEHLEHVLSRRVDLLTPAGLESMRAGARREQVVSGILYV